MLILVYASVGFSDEVKLQRAVPQGILNRVFPFSFNEHSGSCFVIDIENRQYIITARHLVPGIKDNDNVKLFLNTAWINLRVRAIFAKNEKTDIVALAGDKLVAPKMEIYIGLKGIFVGQDVYFLGFPFGLATKFEKPSPTHIAFIKKGILSAIDARQDSGHILYLDGHNNPGFSGGPVIYANYNEHERLEIAGVIAGYKNQPSQVLEAVVDESTSDTSESKKKIVHYVRENTGIVVAFSIYEIIKAIEKSPIGFPLLDEKK